MEQSAAQQSEAGRKSPKIVWGLRAIGEVINRTEEQTGYLVKTGALGDAVTKVNGQHVGVVHKLLKQVNAL